MKNDKTTALINRLNEQIEIHQRILDSHSLCPRDFHYGAIRAHQDAIKIIETFAALEGATK